MKKLIATLLTMLAITAHSRQTVPIVWPFNPAVASASYIRAIIDEANRQQDKYTFVMEVKIGAGGTVAAQYALNHNGPILVSSSSSFFTRPVLYPNESYRTQDFKPVYIQCTGQPYGVISAKFANLDQIKAQKSVTIGGLNGSLTETVARQFAKTVPGVEVIFVPFQATSQATLDMLSGRLDLNVDLPLNVVGDKWKDRAKIYTIGSSGTNKRAEFPSFASKGVSGFEGLVANYQMVAPSTMSDAQAEELHGILKKAAQGNERLLNIYENDYCEPSNMDWNATNEIYQRWSKYWPEKLQSLKK